MSVRRIWLITDGRLGHLNQLRGLLARVQEKAELEVHWFDLASKSFRFVGRKGLLAQFDAEIKPDWVLAAGSKTHIPMLWCKWVLGAKAFLLMRPSLPLRLFDAVCMPYHDSPPKRDSVLGTYGVINHIVPRYEGRNKSQGLMLLGGINTHYQWDNVGIVKQLQRIAEAAPEMEWLVSDSPRTPPDLLDELAALSLANINILPYSDTGPGWLPKILQDVGQVWVSCDSVSMVYESVSSGAPTGLLELLPLRDSRVVKSMTQLASSGLATTFSAADLAGPLPPAVRPLWEADRVADWWLQIDRGGEDNDRVN
jgi:mitochondrial fission protein ELM1